MNKKAFTLIELLAVIVILGLLAVLIVPKVQKTLRDSKKNTYEASAYALSRTAENYYVTQKINLNSTAQCTYDFTNSTNTCNGLEFKGEKPEKGLLKIYKNGNISMAIKFDDYCYIKEKNTNNITSISYSANTCENNERLFLNYNIPQTVTSGDGLYESTTDPGRLIYRGENPNNYINIKEDGTNNTLYRIVSYETDGTIKIVRDEKLSTDMAWDEANARPGIPHSYCVGNGCNIWGSSTTTLHNGETMGSHFHFFYYPNSTATTLSTRGDGIESVESSLNQYLNSKILNSENSWQPAIQLNNYIDNHSWNVGGVYSVSEDKGIIKEKEEEKQLQWIGKIGLLNITEFVEASTSSGCTSVKANFNCASNSVCKTDNWTMDNKEYYQWSITAYPGNTEGINVVFPTGCIGSIGAGSTTRSVRPAFYLKSSIELGGSGTQTNPYYIVE